MRGKKFVRRGAVGALGTRYGNQGISGMDCDYLNYTEWEYMLTSSSPLYQVMIGAGSPLVSHLNNAVSPLLTKISSCGTRITGFSVEIKEYLLTKT